MSDDVNLRAPEKGKRSVFALRCVALRAGLQGESAAQKGMPKDCTGRASWLYFVIK
jgi:hypothetical protein